MGTAQMETLANQLEEVTFRNLDPNSEEVWDEDPIPWENVKAQFNSYVKGFMDEIDDGTRTKIPRAVTMELTVWPDPLIPKYHVKVVCQKHNKTPQVHGGIFYEANHPLYAKKSE